MHQRTWKALIAGGLDASIHTQLRRAGYGRVVGGVKQVQMLIWQMVTVWVFMFWHVVIA